ncbi:hypothetical protein EJ06DRAFT_551112 [Trichodelitschia bisporula]|uniref:IPT/TIG domain-containing protein n=1 Tax=Trichodelitschia bisporula TaxID=703511 RepID=A0A6G1HMC1_9PEZI|nr:hypothetical protein EJ06DRAFT_551112 [Trichodelitschia bisporula]
MLFTSTQKPNATAMVGISSEVFDDADAGTAATPSNQFDIDAWVNTEYIASPHPTAATVIDQPKLVRPPAVQFVQQRSAMSSASPESSCQDSSSDSSGRRKRKSPASSSPNDFSNYSSPVTFDGHMSPMEVDKRRPKVDPVVYLQDGFDANTLHGFSITSAGNSPKMAMTPNMNAMSFSTPPQPKYEPSEMMFGSARAPATFSIGTSSRDNTPPSATMESAPWRQEFSPDGRSHIQQARGFRDQRFAQPTRMGPGFFKKCNPTDVGQAPKLSISPFATKSRVETQINIRLTLDPLPKGIRRLHLPTETISKAKFLAKETPKTPDTLELSTMVVCTSAMEKPANRERALARARSGIPHSTVRRPSMDDSKKGSEPDPADPDSPMNGGPVRICSGCVRREKKRASRKKAKNQENEDIWYQYEQDRIIVFNTVEYKDFHPPNACDQYPDTVRFSPVAQQVDAPMRIACYCRHQSEKLGFQVIFTIKDHEGNVVAQEMSQSILITDDHKTHAPINGGGLPLDQAQYFMQQGQNLPNGVLPNGINGLPDFGLGRAYHSATDLPSMSVEHPQNNQWNFGMMSPTAPAIPVLSRPASPSSQLGPKKKRKSSGGQIKLPATLQMTRPGPPEHPCVPQTSPLARSSVMMSPDGMNNVQDWPMPMAQQQMPQNHFGTNPPTPSGNLMRDAENGYFSVPNSAHPSRAASPLSFVRPQMNAFSDMPAMPQPFASAFTMEETTAQAAQTPTILKVTPQSGPMNGGIDVILLGSNFSRNLEVKFGDAKATTTTFWNSNTLVCLLPPSRTPGPVPVSFVEEQQQGYSPLPTQRETFTYIDDRRNQLFELAIKTACARELGPLADPQQYAQNLLGLNPSMRGGFAGGQASGFNANVLSMVSSEDAVVAMLQKIDLMDSPGEPFFDTKGVNGATMLSLACGLGYERLVAGLLARGADPDVADNGGFTPLMMAAMNGHTAIVRKVILRGADTNLRTLRGSTAIDVAASPEVVACLRQVRRHFRSASAGAIYLRSRANSSVSMRSLWGPPSSDVSDTISSMESESAIDDSEEDEPVTLQTRLASRRASGAVAFSRRNSESRADLVVAAAAATVAANAAETGIMVALRDQLTAQINQLQTGQRWNLPNLPQLPLPPIIQEYQQNFPTMRRSISSLLPARYNGARPASDAISEASSDPPPPYHEACPEGADNDFDTKPPELVETIEASASTAAMMRPVAPRPVRRSGREVVHIGKISPSGEEAAELRRLREQKLTPAKHDRNLWYIWFPLLISLIIWWYSGYKLPAVPVVAWTRQLGNMVYERVVPRLQEQLAPVQA